jgi:hypothetical protein
MDSSPRSKFIARSSFFLINNCRVFGVDDVFHNLVSLWILRLLSHTGAAKVDLSVWYNLYFLDINIKGKPSKVK